MSELTNTKGSEHGFRWRLLNTVSASALIAIVCASEETWAADQDLNRPTVWIELGGQLEGLSSNQSPLAPSFVDNLPDNFFSPVAIQKAPQHSFGGEGSITFEPEGSDWLFSASVRFGRSTSAKTRHQQTPNAHVPVNFAAYGIQFGPKYYYPSSHVKFEDATAKASESHAVIDFQAGRDVGVGILGNHSTSTLSLGIRFAQFMSKSSASMNMEPDVHYPSQSIGSVPGFVAFRTAAVNFHDYAVTAANQRSFHGIGPSIALQGSAPIVGNPDGGEITVDWGANAAVLFGRQMAEGHHQTVTQSFYEQGWSVSCPVAYAGITQRAGNSFCLRSVTHHTEFANNSRSRMVVVPNLGGFAGVSFVNGSAKIKFGYRADFFFGAMDEGIDTRKSETLGFYGPFATISIGLGG